MISERALKGQTDKVYFCTSLVPPNVIPSGSLVLLLLQEQLHKRTWIYQDPPSRVTKGDNTPACYQQLLQVVAANSGGGGRQKLAPRAFAFEIASKIGAEFCQHNSAPEPLADMSAELKKQAAARHPDLYGHPHAWVIAAVKTQDVETKWSSTTSNKYRNPREIMFLLALHACYINARSYGCFL